MANVSVLLVDSEGNLQQVQDADVILAAGLDRRAGSGNLTIGASVSGASEDVVIGGALAATGEVLLGTVASQARALGDLVADGLLSTPIVEISGGGEVRFYDVGDSNYVGFEAPALTANQIWILPDTDSTGTQYLRSDGFGNLSWGTITTLDTITFVDSTSNFVDSTSITVVAPTGIQDGDVLVIIICHSRSELGSPVTWTPPADWTEQVTNIQTPATATSRPGTWVFTKIASSESGNYTFTPTPGTAAGIAGVALCYRGVDNTTPLDQTSTTATGTSTNADPPSITTQTAGAFVVAIGFKDDGAVAISATSSGYDQREIISGDPASGNGTSMGVCDDEIATAGGEDPGAFTSAVDEWAAITLALRPALLGGAGDVSWIGGAAVDNTIARYHETTGKIIQGTGVTIDDSNNLWLDADGSTTGSPRTLGTVNFSATEAVRFEFNQGAGNGIQHEYDHPVTFYAEHTIVLRGDTASTSPSAWDDEHTAGVFIDNTTIGSEALVVRGASGQTADLQEWRTSIDGIVAYVTPDGDFHASTNGSGLTTPRVIGFANLSSGESGAFHFGDANTGLMNGFDQSMHLYGWNPIVLQGDRQTAGQPTYIAASGFDYGTIVINSQTYDIAFAVRAVSGQTAALQTWENSAGTMLAEVQDDGTFNLNNHDIDNAKTVTFNAMQTHGSMGTTETIDWTAGQKHSGTNSATLTITFTAPAGPCNLILVLTNGGAFTITWPGTVDWAGGTEPSWTTSGVDIVAFFYDGTNYYGVASLNFS